MVVRFTGLSILDPIIAVGMAFYILKLAYDTIGKPLLGLVDAKLPSSELAVIESCLAEQGWPVAGFHMLRTRRAGKQRYIDFHLVMARGISLEKAHQMCDSLESDVQAELSQANVTIHIEPCDGKCEQCPITCSES